MYADLEDKDKDEAFKWLNTVYQERDVGLLSLKTDFRLDALRSDPRLAELVRPKVGGCCSSEARTDHRSFQGSGKTPTQTSPF